MYMRPAGGGKPHIGDVRLRFHNSGGIADERKRTRYLRRMAQKVDLLALCETGLDEVAGAEAERYLKHEPSLRAGMWRWAYHRRNTGLALIVPEGAPITGVRVRKTGDEELQLMVADMEIRGQPVRVVVSHGEPGSNVRAKTAFFQATKQAIRRIKQQDLHAGRGGSEGR